MGRKKQHRIRQQEAAKATRFIKEAEKIGTTVEEINEHAPETSEVFVKSKVRGKKSESHGRITSSITRRQAAILEEKEREKESLRKQTQNAREKQDLLREKRKEAAKNRHEIVEKSNMKIKVRKLEKKTKQLEEVIEASNLINASGSSTNSFQPLSIVIEAPVTSQSAPVTPTQNVEFDFERPSSAPPNLDVQSSVKLKQSIGLSEEKYKSLQQQMLSNGVKMPSLSTVKRFENNIYDSYYRNSRTPDFYNLLQEAVDKYDFSSLPCIRITIGGDKGWKSVKIGFYFNDVLLPLSVKKFIIIHTFVGDETRQLLEDVMKRIDDDVRRLNLHGIMTKHGNKETTITYVGDCKYTCTSLGLQGGSAVSACVNCITKRSDWPSIRSEDVILRTIDSIISCAYEVINNNAAPKSNFSVKNYPLLRNIPVSHFVPPPVHILITLLNQTIIFVRKFADDSQPLENFIIANKVKLHNPSREYEGNQCRKIFSNFRANNSKAILYDGFASDLFQAGSNIEQFAVARTLTGHEINELESNINLFFNLLKQYGDKAVKFFLNKNKIHILQHHVVPFVRQFHSWGLFSEQSIESIHHVRNELDRRIQGCSPQTEEKRKIIAFHLS